MDLISLLVTVVVLGLIFWLFWWLIGAVGLPEPFNKVATVLIALIAVLVLLSVLFGGLTIPTLRLR
jgi:Zn-dependent protease with chaperone function